jgi:hypothetical protein
MALFGLPSALFGGFPGGGTFASPRLWFAACFLATMVAAARVAGAGRRTRSAMTLMVACPAVALPLVIGGVDPPVVGLMCLGLAYAGRGNGGRAGVALGLAAALKWTAWPALPVVFVLLTVCRHRRAVLRCAVSVTAVLALACAPVLLTDPRAAVQHVVLYPLGLANVPSSAASPLPGHLLATHLPHGTAVALTAVAIGAVLMGVSLLVRPPRSASAAADRIALGLALAITLAPATRSGYVIYPLLLFCWFRITGRHTGDEGSAPVRGATACRYGRLITTRRRRSPSHPPCSRAPEGTCRHPQYADHRVPSGCGGSDHQPSLRRADCETGETATSVRTGRRPR